MARRALEDKNNDGLKTPLPHQRLLCLDLRPRRTGFAVFDDARTLLDYGVRNFDGDAPSREAIAMRRISSLLDLHSPGVMIIRRGSKKSAEANNVVSKVIQAVQEETLRRSIVLHILDTKNVYLFFAIHGCRTKHQIAMRLAQWFSELAWSLPAKRRPWQNEPHNLTVFDAVAAAIVYFAVNRSE
jgi:hypothetical protein